MSSAADDINLSVAHESFKKITPLLNQYCVSCHNEKKRKGNFSFDKLNQDIVKGRHAQYWQEVLDKINLGEMPPENKKQLTDGERRLLVDTLTDELRKARLHRKGSSANTMRRMTKEQYENTISDLLGIPVTDYADDLPEDGLSPNGFKNNSSLLNMSTLHLQMYMNAARKALDKAVVADKPDVICYRIDLGENINKEKIDEDYMLGKHGCLLYTKHHIITSPAPAKRDYEINISKGPDSYSFNNHYRGNAGVGGKWKTFKGLYHTIYVELIENLGRTRNFPYLYDPTLMTENGVVLTPRGPRGHGNESMPNKNFKGQLRMSLRHYPDSGPLTVRVKASIGPGSLITAFKAKPLKSGKTKTYPLMQTAYFHSDPKKNSAIVKANLKKEETKKTKPRGFRLEKVIEVDEDCIYQVDFTIAGIVHQKSNVQMQINKSKLNLSRPSDGAAALIQLKKGTHKLKLHSNQYGIPINSVSITPVTDIKKLKFFTEYQNNYHSFMKVSFGSRCKIQIPFEFLPEAKKVTAPIDAPQTLEFTALVEDYPIPPKNLNKADYMSYLMCIGIFNAPVSGKCDIMVHSVEFESKVYKSWPPEHHQRIFDIKSNGSEEEQAEKIIAKFLPKAFRRPVSKDEISRHVEFWKVIKKQKMDFKESVKELLAVILSSPQFLHIDKPVSSLEERQFAFASRLSYFLWNSMPDERLLEAAANKTLLKDFDKHFKRMIADPKSYRLAKTFTSQWLHIDKLDQNVNFKQINSDVRKSLKRQVFEDFHYMLTNNSSILDFIKSDEASMDLELLRYYRIQTAFPSHEFKRIPLKGGALHYGAVMIALTSENHGSPIKRGVWVMNRLLGLNVPEPPPDVPELPQDDPKIKKISIKERLKIHSNNAACVDCHRKIDPWGIPLQNIDYLGRKRKVRGKEAEVKFVDGKVVNGVEQLKDYILKNKSHLVNASFVKYISSYALGRTLNFKDQEEIEKIIKRSAEKKYHMQTVLIALIKSELFMDFNLKDKKI